MALLTDELKAMIGREVHYPAREELGQASIRYFALAMGDANPLYVDDAYAREAGYPAAIAPPTLICETCQYAHRPPDEDSYIGHEWQLPVPNSRMIRTGNDYEFMRPIVATDRISVTWKLETMSERNASRGGTQLFVGAVATYRDAAGMTVAINRETMVYQPLVAA